jgi:hypothetical protein
MKFLVPAAFAVASMLAASPVMAAPVNLSGIKCDHPDVIKLMDDTLKQRSADGTTLLSYGVHVGKISKASTIHASKNKLICRITLRASYGGDSQGFRLRFTIEQFGGGKLTAKILPE